MTTPKLDAAQFCETLYTEGCELAQKRLGVLPKAGTIQMADLISAFADLKKGQYTSAFGHIDGEWNDGFTIAKTLLQTAESQKPTLLPDKGYALATIIENWNQFQNLPPEVQKAVTTCKESFLNTAIEMQHRMDHFFNEHKVHMRGMTDKEREEVTTLRTLFQPQFNVACQKEDSRQILSLFQDLSLAIHRLEVQYPSHQMKNFATKSHHDIMTISLFLTKAKRVKK